MTHRNLLAASVLALLAASGAWAEPTGQAIAFACAGCHGTDGRSVGLAPELNGEDAEDLYEMMVDYKTDKDEGTIMNRIAKGYSDSELRAVSEYLSKVED